MMNFAKVVSFVAWRYLGELKILKQKLGAPTLIRKINRARCCYRNGTKSAIRRFCCNQQQTKNAQEARGVESKSDPVQFWSNIKKRNRTRVAETRFVIQLVKLEGEGYSMSCKNKLL